jgi:hypothetical protein
MKPSMTITGLIIILLGFALERSGLVIASSDLQTFVAVGSQILGFIIAYIGRVRHSDVNIFGLKIEDREY